MSFSVVVPAHNEERWLPRALEAIATAAQRVDVDVIVTIDADCVMAPNALQEVARLLATGGYVGGGTKVRMERTSLREIRAVMNLTDTARVDRYFFDFDD